MYIMRIRKIPLILSTFFTVIYSIWFFLFQGNSNFADQISSIAIIIVEFSVVTIGIILINQKHLDLRIRRGWMFILSAALANTIAETIWYYDIAISGTNPFPSWADLFYLLFYPLTLIGVLLLPHKTLKRLEFFTYIFDLSIVMLTFSMIFWYFILAPMHMSSEEGLGGVIAIAYPVGDLLLLAGIVAIIQRNSEKSSHWAMILISFSIIFTAVPDAIFAYYEVNQISYSIARLNLYWVISAWFMVFAAYKQMDITKEEISFFAKFSERSQRIIRIVLPYVAAAAGPLLLVGVVNSKYLTGLQLQGLLVGVIFLVALILGRQHIVLMDNFHLYEETHKMAITDSLTGLFNRHYFNEIFLQEIERASRYDNKFSILLMDVDNFKAINDTFGHLKGDGVLKIIADVLAQLVRQTDILARFGGDEFIVLLPETDVEGANAVAKKLEGKVSLQSFSNTPLSISIGVSTYKPGFSAEQFLEEADRQLYKHKQTKNPNRNIAASAQFV